MLKNLKNHWLIILIFVFCIVVRFWRLGEPSTYYFDEVYTAFTAQSYAKNNPAGYEWWNPTPEGFAYGWTHPPTGKLIGAASILVFGDNTFAWRFFPAVAGSAFVLLFYYVGSKLFSKRIGTIAAILYAAETLFLAQSRILLYDIFLAFFIFSAFFLSYRFLKQPNFKLLVVTGVVFGLAASNKTVGFWGLATMCLLFFGYFLRKKKILQSFSYPAILGVTGFATYLASFTQFFLQGHAWGQLVELHKQIWFYETGLKATHPFSSKWYEWITARGAIWYWTGEQGNLTGNIWAVGNPIIFILGAVSIGYIIYRFLEERKLKFGIILAGYFAFLIPWIMVPRLIFLYHYLPSLTFSLLALAVFLYEIWQKGKVGRFLTGLIIIFAFAIFFYLFPNVTGIYLPETQAKFFNDSILKLR